MIREKQQRYARTYPRCVSIRNADRGLFSLIPSAAYTTNLLKVIVVSSLIFLLMASCVLLMT